MDFSEREHTNLLKHPAALPGKLLRHIPPMGPGHEVRVGGADRPLDEAEAAHQALDLRHLRLLEALEVCSRILERSSRPCRKAYLCSTTRFL